MNTASERTRGPARPHSNRKTANHRQSMRPAQDAQKNYQKYLALARAEALTGDRIAAENYFQHAEHYFRTMRQGAH